MDLVLGRECAPWKSWECTKLSPMSLATEDQVVYHKSFGMIIVYYWYGY
jgi:hypothetical protein